jgi:undecaprenyl-diphosphatase
VTFALASAASGFVPRRVLVVMFATATFVGLSRIYVGAHLPADVVGGAGLGLIVGTASAAVVSLPNQ